MTQKIIVELDKRSYPIHIAPGALAGIGQAAVETGLGRKGMIITDDQVAPIYGQSCENSFASVGFEMTSCVVPAGEPSKCHAQLLRLYDAALDAGLERSSFIVALGGGVIGDLAGYAAASYLRGIDLVQIPTTLLAMVDSAVGGKTGVNLPKGKNLIGAFHQPSLVCIDTDTLTTLPPREFRAGLAEVVKYGVIADPRLWDTLESHATLATLQQDADAITHLVRRSCEIKADVVGKDEREEGLRAILNFGHTIGHAIEQVTGYTTYLHGEAVALGMLFAARLSERVCGFPSQDTERLACLLQRLELPVQFPSKPWEDVRAAMGRDKKKADGEVRFVLAEQLGVVQYGVAVPDEQLALLWDQCTRGDA